MNTRDVRAPRWSLGASRLGFAWVVFVSACAVVRGQDLVVYHDSLAGGWDNWSWNTTLDFANPSPVLGGSGRSIRVQYTQGWAGVFLHTGADITSADYTKIRFSYHGGTSGGQTVAFWVYDAGSSASQSIVIHPVAGTWTTTEITFEQLGVASISGLIWQEYTGGVPGAYFLDEIVIVAGPPAPPPSLAVDMAQDRHAISDDIYGMNFASAELLSELQVPVHRWGGNSTTRYSWQNDTSNRASDWYFENIPNDNPDPGQLPDGSDSDEFIETNRAAGSETLLTVPLIGWTPKARAYACGFSVAKYGAQQSTDPWRPDCGNGVRPDGTTLVTGNDPNDTSTAIGPGFVQAWMAHLIARYGPAGSGGVRFYNLDNEPMLWNSTHRDVHPTPCGFDELRDRTIQYAAAIKAVDSGAATLGPVFWGWSAYFYSALDVAAGGAWWETRPDRRAHGDVPLIEWYLQQMQAYEQSHGTRLLDYMDLHYYPQADSVALGDAGDAATQARRLRSTRSLWDPSYVDESWIGEAVQLIPRMRAWVQADYPGTKTAVSEYNWGGFESINGALAQADVLGIFGRERLDLATLWTAPETDQPVAYAFRLFRNYDGAGGRFGQTSVRAVSTDQARVAVYAAQRSDQAATIVLINKTTQPQSVPLTVASFGQSATAALYRYSAASLSSIERLADMPFAATGDGGPLQPPGGMLTLPASSLTLLVLSASGRAGDLNCDGQVNVADIGPFILALLDPEAYAGEFPGCDMARADVNADGSVDGRDVQAFAAMLVGGELAQGRGGAGGCGGRLIEIVGTAPHECGARHFP